LRAFFLAAFAVLRSAASAARAFAMRLMRRVGPASVKGKRREPRKAAEGWMITQRALWERRLDQLDAHLMDMKAAEGGAKGKKEEP
jgi:hypothetical protein